MNTPLLVFITAALLISLVLTIYVRELRDWQRQMQAFRLYLPRQLTVDDAVRWLSTLAAATHPPHRSLFALPPVGLEVVATPHGIAHYVLVAPVMRSRLLASVQATLPGARLEEAADYLQAPLRLTTATELRLTSRVRPVAFERAEAVSAGLLAALQPVSSGEQIVVQLLLTSAGTPATVPSKRPNGQAALPWWLESSAPADADEVRAQRVKQRDPLLLMVLRIGVTTTTIQRANGLLVRPASMLQGFNAPGVKLVRRNLPPLLITARMRTRRYPLLYWPLVVNAREAAGLAGFPFGAYLPGLSLGRARQLPPPPSLPSHGNVVGISNYPGLAGRELALSTADRLRHVHLIGPTGVGKSTLIARMVLQDIARGAGVVVIDPKGDLVTDIAARVPAQRSADVVILDPSEVETAVIGFNPLRTLPGDSAARELIADNVLSIFHSIYHDFWGPRTDELLRAALFSLTHTQAPDGSAFTIIEVPELLTNPSLRRHVSEQDSLPPYLRSFWQWFDGSLSESDRIQSIGPVLNKLRAFSMRSSIRLMLGQSQGIILDQCFRRQGILLISLAKGKIGSEAASLLGSLFVSALWQATQARITVPSDARTPFFAYFDEFQDIVRLDNGLADMLAQARGLGLSLTLAHQYMSQLPGPIREATLGTVRSHVAFQLEWDDARALEARFAPLTRDDLSGLLAHEFALKPCVNGQTLSPVTGTSLPLDEEVQDPAALARASRERYGLAQADIEAGLRARLGVPNAAPGGRFGREGKRGQP